MTEGLRRHRFLHTASDILFYCDNPTVLFAVRSQSTSPSKEVEALFRVRQNGGSKPPPYKIPLPRPTNGRTQFAPTGARSYPFQKKRSNRGCSSSACADFIWLVPLPAYALLGFVPLHWRCAVAGFVPCLWHLDCLVYHQLKSAIGVSPYSSGMLAVMMSTVSSVILISGVV